VSGLLLPVYIILFVGLIYFFGVRPSRKRRLWAIQNSAPPPVRPIEITTAPQNSAESSTAEPVDLPCEPPSSPPGRQAGRDTVEQLERLVRLRDSGSINGVEFETAKAALLKGVL